MIGTGLWKDWDASYLEGAEGTKKEGRMPNWAKTWRWRGIGELGILSPG